MAQSLTKTSIIFGVVIFYVCIIFFLGLIPNNNGIYTPGSTGGIGYFFQNVILNIAELGWLNTLLFIPLISLVIFMFATSSAIYNIE